MHSECVLACHSGVKRTRMCERESPSPREAWGEPAPLRWFLPFHLGVGKSLPPCWHLPADLAPVPPTALPHLDGELLLRILMQAEAVMMMMMMEQRQVKLPCSTEESSRLQSTEEDMSAFSLRCSKGLLVSVWLGKSLMGPDMCLNLQ